ncbi:MAG: MBOAT family O-acyltransferase [Anaerolineales bacterium]|jgi:alginate O-acetyltransferase complex protein AlgI|nr:MBOAT family O-acyltransferase [Anaerolineales bacterium]
MNFSTPTFLFLFLPLFLTIFLLSQRRWRVYILAAASLIFLVWGQPVALIWLGAAFAATYGFGLLAEWGRGRRLWLWAGILTNLALLVFFKWVPLYGLAWLPLSWSEAARGLAVPLGLSYFAFQAVSYLVDTWRGTIPAERNPARLALYLLFFPKLVSGPLVRFKPFNSQLDDLNPGPEQIAGGIRRLLAGFVKRALIANQLAIFVDAAFNQPTANLEPRFAWLALLAYALQIYFDFSGYTDMALGLAEMVGIKLPENFNLPYMAESISDFWRRWHISLANWFREYVFFPFERRRLPFFGQQINILIVFALTGLWHGFKPTFLAWGLLHGLAIALESRGFGRWLKSAWRPLRHLYTLTIVLAGWVFFRAGNFPFALEFFRRLIGDTSGLAFRSFQDSSPLPFVEPSFVIALLAGLLFCLPLGPGWRGLRSRLEASRPGLFFVFQPLEDGLLAALFILGLAALLASGFSPNIYATF